MQTSVKIPKSTFLQCYAYFHKWPLSVLFQSVPGYEEVKSGLPSTVTVKYPLSARLSHSPRWSSFSFPVISWGGGRRKRKEARSIDFASTSPGSHTTHPAGLVPSKPWVGKWLQLGPMPTPPCLPTFPCRKYHPLPPHLRLPVPIGVLTISSLHWCKWLMKQRSDALLGHLGDPTNGIMLRENSKEEASWFWSHSFIKQIFIESLEYTRDYSCCWKQGCELLSLWNFILVGKTTNKQSNKYTS